MTTYRVTLKIPIPVTYDVDVDPGDTDDGSPEAMHDYTTPSALRSAIAAAAKSMTAEQIGEAVGSADWDSAEIVNETQAQIDDQRADDARDGDGCHDDSEVSS